MKQILHVFPSSIYLKQIEISDNRDKSFLFISIFARWQFTDNEIHTTELSHKLTKWRAYEISTWARAYQLLFFFFFVLLRHESKEISILFACAAWKSVWIVLRVYQLIREIVIFHSLDESSFCLLNFFFLILYLRSLFSMFLPFGATKNQCLFKCTASVKWFLVSQSLVGFIFFFFFLHMWLQELFNE